MLPEETPTPDQSTPNEANPADRMSILEARLAEIRAKQGDAQPETSSAAATPAAPALSDTPAEAAVPPGGGATQTEPDPLLSEPGLSEATGVPAPAPVNAPVPTPPR